MATEGKANFVVLQHAVDQVCLHLHSFAPLALASCEGQHAHRALTVAHDTAVDVDARDGARKLWEGVARRGCRVARR